MLSSYPAKGRGSPLTAHPLERVADLVGRFPVVVLSPGDHDITSGAPDERRRLVDNILSQAHPVYFADLMAYRRALKQRNTLLRQMAARRASSHDQLDAWTDECVRLGSRIVHRRDKFILAFSVFLDEAYRTIESVAEKPAIRYKTLVEPDERSDEDNIARRYRERCAEVADREREQGRTLAGPHRDEFVMTLDDLEVRRYASQGQHRTFALALKLAQYFYIQASREEPPVFLLDDALDNLDPARRAAILTVLQSDTVGQSLITAADVHFFTPALDIMGQSNRLIRIDAGHVVAPL